MNVEAENSQVNAEDPAVSDTSQFTEGQTNQPTDEMETLKAALSESQDKYMRLAAEFENFKRRTARERLELISSANDNLLLQMLETVDNFERALESAESGQENSEPQKLYHALHEGARMIHQQLLAILKAHGVEEIETEGKQFDPALHEAVLQIESEEHDEDHIAQVISKGYKRGDRVLRHARVGVASRKSHKKTQE